MFSAATTVVGDRPRRAKSSSSATSQPSRAVFDPQQLHQQAEVAAVEAYERARLKDESGAVSSKPRLNRRRSHISGMYEGGHFEEARRRSFTQAAAIAKPKSSQSPFVPLPHHSSSIPATQEGLGETVITRRRSVIRSTNQAQPSQHEPSSSISSNRPNRIRPFVQLDGSPAPRYSQYASENPFDSRTRMAEGSKSWDDQGSTLVSDYCQKESVASHSPSSPAKPTLNTAKVDVRRTTEQSLEQAQQQRLREKRSFFGSFQKRRTTGNHFDTFLPPFNYAGDKDAAPDLGSSDDQRPSTSAMADNSKARNFSISMKGRLKQVFKKTSKPTIGLPAQHIQAANFHFTVKDYDTSEAVDHSFVDFTDPFMTVAAEEPSFTSQARPDSKLSTAKKDSARSRVTSWTNSTMAAMSSLRTERGPFAVENRPPEPEENEHSNTIRKRSSFFGNPVRNRLRRASKTELKDTEETAGLYSALQKRIRSTKSTEPMQPTVSTSPELVLQSTTNALASLPSQNQHRTLPQHRQAARANMMRAVSPDLRAWNVHVPSPVHEVASPAVSDDNIDDTVIRHVYDAEEPARNLLMRRSAIKGSPLSEDARRRRMVRARNRWQSPLEGIPPTASGDTHGADSDLSGEPHRVQKQRYSGQMPRTAYQPVTDSHYDTRGNVISPSVYSRATNDASPRPLSPELGDGTAITITGTEVRRYSISPVKAQHRGHGSGAWRKWLSDEMNSSLGNSDHSSHLSLAHGLRSDLTHSHQRTSMGSSGHKRSMPSVVGDLRPRSISPLSDDGATVSRPSSTVSAMDDRYPMMATSRNSSQHSVRTARPGSRATSPDGRFIHSIASSRKPSIESALSAGAVSHPRTSQASHPLYELECARSQSALESERSKQMMPGAESINPRRLSKPTGDAEVVNRPKSAYELRATYKSGMSGKSRAIEVRRKPIDAANRGHQFKASNATSISMIDDHTIRNISAGPYATPRPPSVNHENLRPPSANHDHKHGPSQGALPALSSSEWLATGSSQRKQRVEWRSAGAPSVPRQSPSLKTSNARTEDVRRSPGQRLATNWLVERKSRDSLANSKENSPAFV